MLRKISILTAFALFIPLLVPSARAQGIKAEYTEQNGARAIGMGHAFTGVAEGLPTVLWNPAGLVSLSRLEVYFSRYQGFSFTVSDPTGNETEESISFNFFNVGMPIKDIGVVAFSMNLWDLGSSEITDIGQDFRGIDNQSLWMFYGSFATRLRKNIDIGVTMKYIREKLSSSAGGIGTSAAVDMGVLYRPLNEIPLQVGFALLDLGSNMQFTNEYQADRLPRRFRIGAGYNILKHLLEQERFNLLLSADYERFLVGNPANTGYFIGSEFSIEPFEDMLLAVRSGYQSEEGDLSGALIGFGVNWKGYSFDIARELGVNPLSDRTFYAISAHF
ncbi:MAG TPA: PorV/PorQ family protein [archaeon]|nr:PorV/PorQ family protein [archaeon]